MSKEKTNIPDHASEMDPSIIKTMQKKMFAFYKGKLSQLKLQCRYETLVADIEDARLRAAVARYKYVQLNNQMNGASEENTVKKAAKKTNEKTK